MKNKKLFGLRFIVGIIFISILFVGCNADNNTPGNQDRERENREDIKPQDKDEPAPDNREGKDANARSKDDDDAIPDSLDDIEDEASDIAEDISKGNWTKVESKLSEIEKEWSKYESVAKESEAPQSQIDNFDRDLGNLKKLVQDKNEYEASLAANKLAIRAMDFMELHSSSFSIPFDKLELYEEQILLTGKNEEWEQAKLEQEAARDLWDSIKPDAERTNADRTKKIDDIMADIVDAIESKDAKSIRSLCDDLDDELDRLEDDFER